LIGLSLLINTPFVLVLTIAIPLAVLFYVLRRFLLGNQVQQSAPPPTQPPLAREERAAQVTQQEDQIKPLVQKMDKLRDDLVKVITNNAEELRKSVEAISSSLEEALVSIKSVEADRKSPFNLTFQEGKEIEAREPRGSPELEGQGELRGLKAGVNVDLPNFVKLCVLLEVMDYDDSKVRSLYELGLLSPDDMRVVMKVEEFLRQNSGKVKALDLAKMAVNVAESYGTVTPEMKRFLLLVTGEVSGQ
jgi:hypothetical protein